MVVCDALMMVGVTRQLGVRASELENILLVSTMESQN